RVAAALDIPAVAVRRERRTEDRPAARKDLAFCRLAWRRRESRVQPRDVLFPQFRRRFAGRALRVGVDRIPDDLAAVALHKLAHRSVAIALAQEREKVAAVQII